LNFQKGYLVVKELQEEYI